MKHLLKIGSFLAYAILAIASLPSANAQQYPAKSLRLIVPFPPGGGIDTMARIVGEKMSQSLGQSVIIDNRPGGNTVIGAVAAAKSPADGYTLFYSLDISMTLNQFLYAKLPYDPVKDFAPISTIGTYSMLIVAGPKLPIAALSELIAHAKANPGRLNYGTGSPIARLAGELFKSTAGIDMVNVPFKGAAPAVQALLGSEIDLAISDFSSALGNVRQGKLKALATTGTERSIALPNVPTVKELGYERFEVTGWSGMFAPKATPDSIIDRLNHEINKIVALADVTERFQAITSAPPSGSTAAELAARLKADVAKWDALIKSKGIDLSTDN